MRIGKLIPLILLAAAVCTQYACKKNNGGAPAITSLRASAPAPNDSTLTKAGPGQVVVIQGAEPGEYHTDIFQWLSGPIQPGFVCQ